MPSPDSIHDELGRRGLDSRVRLESTEQVAGDPVMLGGYAILGTLGAGGMGEVLRVRDRNVQRDVAAKVATKESRRAVLRLMREGQLTGQLEHPNIVPLYELGLVNETPYFTMRRIGGRTLTEAIDDPGSRLPVLLEAFLKICDAVGYAHSRGVIHRDLKPSNVMVGSFGEVYVMDWGLARPLRALELALPQCAQAEEDDAAAADALRTRDGALLGTPAYMPPEQAAGRLDALDERSDVYALGAILYQVLTGSPPFVGATVWSVIDQVATGKLIPPSERSKGVPRELEAVVLKAMAFEQGQRYASVGELRADVTAYLEGRLLDAARYSATERLRKWLGRHPAVAAVLLTVLLGGGAMVLHQARATQRERGQRLRALADAVGAAGVLERELPREAIRAALTAPERGAERLGVAGRRAAAALIQALQRYADAQSRVVARALEVGDRPAAALARRRQLRALVQLTGVAGYSEDFAAAELALEQARSVAGSRARLVAIVDKAGDGLERARGARASARRLRVAARLTQAREGGLAPVGAFEGAVVELAGYRDGATIEALGGALSSIADRMWDVWRARLVAAGGAESAGEVDAWIAARRKGQVVRLAALGELMRRGGPDWHRAVAAGQQEATGAVDLDASMRVIELLSKVLLYLGDDGAVGPLTDYVIADAHPTRPVPAAQALGGLAAAGSIPARERLDWFSGRLRLRFGSAQVEELLVESWRRARGAGSGSGGGSDVELSLVGTAEELMNRGTSLLVRGELDAAWRVARHVLARPGLDVRLRGEALVLRARIRMRRGDARGALKDYDLAIRTAGEHPGYYYNRGMVLAAMGDWQGALKSYDRALALEPGMAKARINRALIYHRQLGQLERALAEFEVALRAEPERRQAMLGKAKVLLDMDRVAEAAALIERTIALHPTWSAAHFHAARAYRRLGERERSGASLDRALELEPRHAGARELRTHLRIFKGDADGALEDATVLVRETGSLDSYKLRGEIAVRFGRVAVWMREADQAIAAGKTAARMERAVLRESKGDVDGALADLNALIAKRPRAHQALSMRGRIGFRRDRVQGMTDFDRAVALAPGEAVYRAQRAWGRRMNRDHDGARADIDVALKLDPYYVEALSMRAEMHREAGQLDAARADLDRAVMVQPSSLGLRRARLRVNELRKDARSQLVDLDVLVASLPKQHDLRFRRAMLRDGLGLHEQAIADYAWLLRVSPGDPRLHTNIGLSRLDLGQLDKAEAELRRALASPKPPWQAARGLALVLHARGDAKGVVTQMERAIALAPEAKRADLRREMETLRAGRK